jgi:hypothetical protein
MPDDRPTETMLVFLVGIWPIPAAQRCIASCLNSPRRSLVSGFAPRGGGPGTLGHILCTTMCALPARTRAQTLVISTDPTASNEWVAQAPIGQFTTNARFGAVHTTWPIKESSSGQDYCFISHGHPLSPPHAGRGMLCKQSDCLKRRSKWF